MEEDRLFRIEKEIGIVEVLSAFRIRSGVIGISRRDGIKPGFEEREGVGVIRAWRVND